MSGEATVTFTGNTTSEATLRFTGSGVACTSFTVAVTGRKKDGDAWVDDSTAFYRCSVWRDMAEHVANSLTRQGIRVSVVGRLKVREYQDRDGKDRTSLDVDVDEVGPSLRFGEVSIPPKAERSQSSGSYGASQAQSATPATPVDDPWATGSDSSMPF